MSPVQLPLRLLGSFQVGEETNITLRRKNRAILAYLALSPRSLTRHELTNIFCRSAADPAHTLRLSLSRLRRNLGQAALIHEGETVQFNQDHFQTDFHLFQKLLAQTELHDISLARLEKVVSLYRGEFIEGLHLPDAPEFEMWLVGQRSYWRQLFERGALAWCKRLLAAGQYATAMPVAQQLVQQNSLLEEAHYHLIWLYAQTDQRSAALAQYKQCQTILQRELAVEPTPALQTLYEDILSGPLTQPHEIQPAARSFTMSSTAADFVGREAELAQVQQVWVEVVAGHGRSLLITSPAGGGKTRLVQEIVPRLPAALFLKGNCYESARALSYQPWIQILEEFLSQNGKKTFQQLALHWQAELSRLLPHLAAGQISLMSEGNREQLFAAVVALLQQADRPLLLFLDDLQWADEASLQLFHFVLERMKNNPLLLLGTYRKEEAEDNPALPILIADLSRHPDSLTLTLGPLSATAVNSLIAQLWPQLPTGYRTPHLRDSIGQATGGNPLFAIEIIRELAGLAHIPDELPVPPSLRDLIARRLRQLPASSRQVLESLTILDQPAYFDLAQHISGRSENETLQAMDQGLRWRLLQIGEDDQIDFSHDLMRQGIWEQLNPIRRKLLHRRTAVVLSQQDTPAATLAYHWAQAGDLAQESKYATLAGREAADLYAYQEAIHYWQRALELSSDSLAKAALYHQLGRVLLVIGEWDEAEANYQKGLVLAGAEASIVKADIQAAYGLLLEYKGAYAAALVQEESALYFFQTVNDRPKISRTLGLIALLFWRQAQYDDALQTCQQALADPEALADATTHIRLLNISGLIYWRKQAYDTALGYLQQAYKLALRYKNQQYEGIVLSNLGNVVQEIGQYDQAINYYQQALKLSKLMKNKMGIAMNLGNLGLMYFYKGDDKTAIEYGRQALQMDRELGNQESVARHLSNLANSYSRQGRYEEAFDYCQQALLIDASLGNRRGALIHAGNLSSIYLLWGQAGEALACLAYAINLDDRLEHSRELARHLTDIVAIYLFTNQLSQAERICQWAMKLQQELALDFELCWASLVQGRLELALERYEPAVTSLKQAQKTAQSAHRSDVQFEAGVLLPRVQWLAGKVEKIEAQYILQEMLENQRANSKRAAILYELWQLDNSTHNQNRAKQTYERFLQRSFTVDARDRALELGAVNLPPLPVIPPLPEPIDAKTLDIYSLLEKVEQTLFA